MAPIREERPDENVLLGHIYYLWDAAELGEHRTVTRRFDRRLTVEDPCVGWFVPVVRRDSGICMAVGTRRLLTDLRNVVPPLVRCLLELSAHLLQADTQTNPM